MTKQLNTDTIKNTKNILELLDHTPEGEWRADIRKTLKISEDGGKTKKIFNYLVNIKVLDKEEGVSKGGKKPQKHKITEYGKGYLQCMRDYGLSN